MSKKCSPGYIKRKSFQRKSFLRRSHSRKGYTTKTGKKVPPTTVSTSYVNRSSIPNTCVPDKGKRGKTPESEKVLPTPGREISLRSFGYSVYDTTNNRQHSLVDAAEAHNPLTILRRLNNLRNLQPEPDVKRIMSRDVEFMKKYYSQYKNQTTKSNRSSRRQSRNKNSRKGSINKVKKNSRKSKRSSKK